ncbi:MAG: radical SAM protein [Eubacterium sp.]|nr:radical SAM protein [Eubacterium sp.]
MKKGNISIFVPHIGCPQKCSFCNQNTITGSHSAPTPDDVKKAVETALLKTEYEYEIAFFGGSFTAIKREYMVSLLEAAKPYVESGKIKGIRCSTRPDAIDDEILSVLKAYGVTAIELGAQSMNDDVLSANLRGHTADDVRNASRLIEEYGFELGLQMMTDLYLSSPELDIETAKEIIKLNPDTVRIYPTVTLKNTYLEKLMLEGKYTPSSIESTISLCAQLMPMFLDRGIKIIRLGLHASDDVKENMLGGGYHESLGEMVWSRILLNQILENPPGEYTAYINEKTVSKLKGNKKSNITALENAGYNIKIIYDNSLSANELRLKNGIKNT